MRGGRPPARPLRCDADINRFPVVLTDLNIWSDWNDSNRVQIFLRRFLVTTIPQPINLFEFEALAKERLSKERCTDYFAGGATDEIRVRPESARLYFLGLSPARTTQT